MQPEKGHETLYVVRELRAKRVWFAEALLSSSADEVRRLLAKAKDWAEQLGKPVELWMSDKQDAFVKGIAAEFPDVPHRYCQNHFLRDLAKQPCWSKTATTRSRCARRSAACGPIGAASAGGRRPAPPTRRRPRPTTTPAARPRRRRPKCRRGRVVLDYCAAVRGILNDDQGGPLHPPGLRMAEALTEVRESLQRNLEAKKGGAARSN